MRLWFRQTASSRRPEQHWSLIRIKQLLSDHRFVSEMKEDDVTLRMQTVMWIPPLHESISAALLKRNKTAALSGLETQLDGASHPRSVRPPRGRLLLPDCSAAASSLNLSERPSSRTTRIKLKLTQWKRKNLQNELTAVYWFLHQSPKYQSSQYFSVYLLLFGWRCEQDILMKYWQTCRRFVV